jgi:His/Glu/Gln/Arg/opine family amino acid ABC transporter permease subunit
VIRRPRDLNAWNRIISVVMILIAAGVIVPWLWHKYQTRPPWWDPVQHLILHDGLKETARMAALSLLGALSIGIVLGTLLTIHFLPSRAVIRAYIEVWRGLPIIVTLFLVTYALPRVNVLENAVEAIHRRQLSLFEAATVALILWGSAQVAEATRGAVQSIPREQHEAASALGFGWVGRHAFVILPQAARRLLPPMIGLLVNGIQNTTIAGLIGVGEVLETGNRSSERLLFATGSSHALPIFVLVMVVFFVISFPLTRLAAFLEKRLA